MIDYTKWDKFLAEVTDSENERFDFNEQSKILKNEENSYFSIFQNVGDITKEQKKKLEFLRIELEKGGKWKEYNGKDTKEEFFQKRMEFMAISSKICIKLLEDCLTFGIHKRTLTQILLDDPSIRFYYLLVPCCFYHLYFKYKISASIIGPKNGLTIPHVCAFWGYDNFLQLLFNDKININLQDKEGFTVLHYLVERCKRFWDNSEINSLTNILNILEKLNLNYQIQDHRGTTALELINIYLSKGSFCEDGTAEAPPNIMKFRRWLISRV